MTNISSINPFVKTSTLLRAIVLIFVIFLSSSIYSQRLPLDGKISTAEDIDVEGINILNLSSNKGTVTDEKGTFRIAASLNDTLSISAIHIQSTIIIIGEEQMINKKIKESLATLSL